MPEESSRSRLGRGLAALLGEAGDDAAAPDRDRTHRRVPTASVKPNPRNPRRNFDDDELEDLANSIRERGILQPILVRPAKGDADAFEIVAGERRWRAAQRASLHEVPVLVVRAADREALEIAIVENVQRSDLNALEEALGYEQLITQFSHSQNELARIVGKSRSHIANTLRLLKLSESVRIHLAAGEISSGHARALLSVAEPEKVARRIVDEGLTVRDVERIAQRDSAPAKSTTAVPQQDADTQALERDLAEALGLKVAIRGRGETGELRIRYATLEQLDEVVRRLKTRAKSVR